MANKKTSTTRSSSGSKVSLNKVAFWTIVVAAVLYLVGLVLSVIGLNAKIIGALQGVATAVMVSIVAVVAWRYVSNKSIVWKVLYVVVLLVVIAGIIVPLVL